MAIIAGAVLLIAVNVIVVSVMVKYGQPESGIEKTALYISAPFQNAFHFVVNGSKNLWRHYFFLVFAARENEQLKKTLQAVREKNRRLAEIELANIRLRRLLEFRETIPYATISAEVVGRDPSRWFKTIVVNKGTGKGVRKGLPVVRHRSEKRRGCHDPKDTDPGDCGRGSRGGIQFQVCAQKGRRPGGRPGDFLRSGRGLSERI